MTPAERAALLSQAADLVNEVVADLDVSETKCKCCNLSRKTNLMEYRASQELAASMNKLEKWAAQLADPNGRHDQET